MFENILMIILIVWLFQLHQHVFQSVGFYYYLYREKGKRFLKFLHIV